MREPRFLWPLHSQSKIAQRKGNECSAGQRAPGLQQYREEPRSYLWLARSSLAAAEIQLGPHRRCPRSLGHFFQGTSLELLLGLLPLAAKNKRIPQVLHSSSSQVRELSRQHQRILDFGGVQELEFSQLSERVDSYLPSGRRQHESLHHERTLLLVEKALLLAFLSIAAR